VNFAHIAAWEHNTNGEPIRHSEPLQFTALQPSTRSYK
jgi:succinate dehydrogenase / fumarate reductase flavoprotein subunit